MKTHLEPPIASEIHESVHSHETGPLMDRLRDQVEHHPVKSLAAVAGVGFVAAKVLPWIFKSRFIRPVAGTAMKTAASLAIPMVIEVAMKALFERPHAEPAMRTVPVRRRGR